ncbi:response regulator transcription factor [soil metagenome]
MIRVVIADDQAMVRSGLNSLLSQEPSIDVVDEAADGEAAICSVRRHQPDVVLMDIRMPVLDGLSATRQLVHDYPRVRILVLTTFDLDEYVFEALRAGASGFLLKDATAEELVDAVRVLAAGEALLDPTVTRRVIDAFVDTPLFSPSAGDFFQGLTAREVEVLKLVARGFSNAEIARELYISDATAKTHVSSVLNKLQLRDRVQAVICAYERGLIQ